ncbi:MAG: hypothetical protein RR356_06625 [Bacteroidales bacterium]
MERIVLSDYMNEIPIGKEAALNRIKELQQQYPASSWLNLFYLKLLQDQEPRKYEKEKARWLLTFYNRTLFHQYKIDLFVPLEIEEEIIEESVQEEEFILEEEELLETGNGDGENETPEVIHEFTIRENSKQEEETVIDNLIDKFSNDPPKIKYIPEKHDADANYVKESLEEDPELISETLAVIYAKQGYHGKALKMYKKLSLHFPEKSCYFAAQIEKLKSEKDNNQ